MDFKLMFITIGISFLLSIILGPLTIPFLRRLKFSQQVRGDGPQAHLKKAGTPTMGGVIILLAFTLPFLRFSVMDTDFYILLISTLGFGLIGFLDDYIKIVFKRSLGLTAKQKLISQIFCAGIICILLWKSGHSTIISIPRTTLELDFGLFYYPFIILMMLAVSNAVNFTDGLDGLLAGMSAITFSAFALIAIQIPEISAAVSAAAMIGGVLGFLVFNAYPAKVFMGDTGSLGIGGAIATMAILTKTELLIIVIGGIFVIEMLSVIIQVISFKMCGRRVFKMSPIHHHFELCGWSEWKVVITFWLAGIALAALGIWLNKGL